MYGHFNDHGERAERRVAVASPQSAGDDANWWMITLSDLTLLLLGFFVLWYVTNNKKPALPAASASAPLVEERREPRVAPVENGLKPEEWQAIQNDMKNIMGEAPPDVTVEFAQHEILLSLKDTLPFDSGKAELRPQAFAILEKVVALLVNHPVLSLEITGHTDSVPIATAAFPSNWELSSARASRVARYLIEQGIEPVRIAVQGYADHRPRVADSTAASRRENRRVELRLYHNSAGNRPSDTGVNSPGGAE